MILVNRSSYLQAFKDGLHLFEESYQQSKVLDLDDKISKMIKNGKKEEDVLQELGDVSHLIQQVYKENHVDYQSYLHKKGFFVQKFEQLSVVVNHVIEVMSQNSAKANVKILFDIFILLILISIIKIPFILVRDLGDSVLDFLASPLLINIWHLVMELIYIVVAVVVFLNIFRKWVANLKAQAN